LRRKYYKYYKNKIIIIIKIIIFIKFLESLSVSFRIGFRATTMHEQVRYDDLYSTSLAGLREFRTMERNRESGVSDKRPQLLPRVDLGADRTLFHQRDNNGIAITSIAV